MRRTTFLSARTTFLSTLSAVLIALPVAGADGWYWGFDVGMALPGDLSSTRTNVGVPTNCDQWLTPATQLPDGRTVPLPLADPSCGGGPRPLPARAVDFDLGAGLLAGLGLGFRRGELRFEMEYFRRGQDGEEQALVVPGDDKQVEFVERNEVIGDVRGDNVFANVYYDFPSRSAGKITPYVGVGIGAMRLGIDYSATSRRNSDRAALLELNRNPNAAGTTSRADESLTDTLPGYQIVGGLRYALSEGRSLDMKVRYGNAVGDFEDANNAWKPLRDHASTVAPGGAPIHYGIVAADLGFWAVSVGLKLDFD